MDPCIVDYLVEIPTKCSFLIEFIAVNNVEWEKFFFYPTLATAGHHMSK
jgi:hypothetical protein